MGGDDSASGAPVDLDGDGVSWPEDCDDEDPAIYPTADERCDGSDDDCDGRVDEGVIETWFADEDGDGFGDLSQRYESCEPPTGYVEDSTDCDDAEGSVHPGAAELWYDGVDQDCAGDDDFDADADGDRSDAYGGEDCDDQDPERLGGQGCRPPANCTHPSAETLAAEAPGSASDVAFTSDCGAVIGTQLSGFDQVRVLYNNGASRELYWTTDQRDVGAVAVSPMDGTIYAVFNSTSSVGVESEEGFSIIAEGVFTEGSNRDSFYANWSPSSAAMDAQCLWIPNFAGAGSLSCVAPSGSQSVLTTLPGYIEALTLDVDGALLASVGEVLYQVNVSTGEASPRVTAGGVILDAVVDYNSDLYIETRARDVELHPGDGGEATRFASIEGDGKLTISPDGWLVRLVPVVNGASAWQEWDLDDDETD